MNTYTGIGTVLAENFDCAEAQLILHFFREKGFCQTGKLAIAGAIVHAKTHGKLVKDVVAVCEQQWNSDWQFQHPMRRGDPAVPDDVGKQSREALVKICQVLEIPEYHHDAEALAGCSVAAG